MRFFLLGLGVTCISRGSIRADLSFRVGTRADIFIFELAVGLTCDFRVR